MLLYVGVGFLTAAGLLVGFDKVAELKREILFLEGFDRLLGYMAAEIESFARPLPEIYASFHNAFLEKSGFLEMLKRNGLTAALENASLGEEEAALLLSFAVLLGRHGAAEEVALCRRYSTVLKERIQEKTRAYPGKARLWRIVPVLTSAAFLLLLW